MEQCGPLLARRGAHRLDVATVDRASPEKMLGTSQVVTLAQVAEVDVSAHRRSDNLVVEAPAQPLQATDAPQRFEFSTVRDGWVFIKVETEVQAPGLSAVLGTDDTVISAATDRREAFREQPRGRHSIAVRSIGELFDQPACAGGQVPQNGKHDWDFHIKPIFPAVTTLNGGNVPEEHRAEVRARGLKWLANIGTTGSKDAPDLVKRMSEDPGMTAPRYDGFTAAERFLGRTDLAHDTEILRLLHNPETRLIYARTVAKPGLPGTHNGLISAALSASRRRGRLLFEAYCSSRPSEEDAAAYLSDRVVGTTERLGEYFPNAAAGTGMICGSFNQIPIIWLDVNPEADYKH